MSRCKDSGRKLTMNERLFSEKRLICVCGRAIASEPRGDDWFLKNHNMLKIRRADDRAEKP